MNPKIKCDCGLEFDDLWVMLSHKRRCPFEAKHYHWLELLYKK